VLWRVELRKNGGGDEGNFAKALMVRKKYDKWNSS